MTEKRQTPFKRNALLESFLKEVNDDLSCCEGGLLAQQNHDALDRPVIVIVGPLRSGTTLLLQWIGLTGLAAVPTNLLSRFYGAPIIGAKIQLLLSDPRYQFRDELEELAPTGVLRSENGKTRGALSPNEFWYFWRRYLPRFDEDCWTDQELREFMNVSALRAELNGMMAVFGLPFAAKGALFNYNLKFLSEVLDKAVFLHVKRDPSANVASALDARVRQLGSVDSWYSFRIPECEELSALPPAYQAAGQIYHSHAAIERGLSSLPDTRTLVVEYEQFCASPRRYFSEISERFNALGYEARGDYTGPESLVPTRTSGKCLDPVILDAVKAFWD